MVYIDPKTPLLPNRWRAGFCIFELEESVLDCQRNSIYERNAKA